jgi:hypothetical protein
VARTRVKLSELLLAVEHISSGGFGETEAYLARDTGAIHVVGDEFASDEVDEPAEDASPTDIGDPDRYLGIPPKSDLGFGKRLALRFAWAHLGDDDANLVEGYFRHQGAYANFKALLEQRRLLQQWYDHEERAIRQELEIGRASCRERV